jgi:hypothetical protein
VFWRKNLWLQHLTPPRKLVKALCLHEGTHNIEIHKFEESIHANRKEVEKIDA